MWVFVQRVLKWPWLQMRWTHVKRRLWPCGFVHKEVNQKKKQKTKQTPTPFQVTQWKKKIGLYVIHPSGSHTLNLVKPHKRITPNSYFLLFFGLSVIYFLSGIICIFFLMRWPLSAPGWLKEVVDKAGGDGGASRQLPLPSRPAPELIIWETCDDEVLANLAQVACRK